MTREEAKKEIIDMANALQLIPNTPKGKAVSMALKALEQEPCEDDISRQAVLDGLASIAKAKAKSDAQKSLMGRVMFFTEHLPSVKPQEPKWIPVLERSPEKSGKYLAYIINKNDDKLQYIMTCEYFVGDYYWHWFPDDECASDNVIAWMPLPEPYKAGGEG